MTADDIAEVRGANCAPFTWPNFYMSALGHKRTFAVHKPMSAKCQKRTSCNSPSKIKNPRLRLPGATGISNAEGSTV